MARRFDSISILILLILLTHACVKRPFIPVNEGREYGNAKTPWVVSHLPEANQWALRRTGHHHVFQKILCFSYPCRKMIGRRKVLNGISFEAFKKRIKKNAKKGVYDKYKNPRKEKIDSIRLLPDSVNIVAASEPPLAIEAPLLKSDSLIVLSDFLFEINSYKLNQNHYAELDSLGKFLQSHPTLIVEISGHTDNTGSERHNVALSARRAEVVAEYLVDEGAWFDKIYFEGFGSSNPIADNATPEGRSKNRRVEILIKGIQQE